MNPEAEEIYKIIRDNFPEELVSGRYLKDIVERTYELTIRKNMYDRNKQVQEIVY